MPDRCSPEYERTPAEMGAMLPYRRAHRLLEKTFPLGGLPTLETIRRRTLRVGGRLECEAAAPRSKLAEAKANTLVIDSAHVRLVRTYQVRTFEIFVVQVSNDNGKHVVFASVPAEAHHQGQQLRGVLHDLGATLTTSVTILSDGAEGPRGLGQTASPSPTHHVLDWWDFLPIGKGKRARGGNPQSGLFPFHTGYRNRAGDCSNAAALPT